MPRVERVESINHCNGTARPSMLPCEVPGFMYRGGKFGLRRQIIRFCKLKGRTFIEPYAGRANVMLLMRAVGDYQKWIINDLHTFDFLMAVKNYNGRELPVITNDEIGVGSTHAYRKYPDQEAVLLMEPMLFWSGGMAGTASPRGDRSLNVEESTRKWRDRLIKAQSLLSDVEILQLPAVDVINEFSQDPNNFIYLDPPYDKSEVSIYGFSKKDRVQMIDALVNAKCSWILSEYRCDDLIDAFGEPVAEIYAKVDHGSRAWMEERIEVECLYSNYKPILSTFDFGDSKPLLPVTVNLLKKYGKLNMETWDQVCPSFWKESTRYDQFRRMTRQPNTYYDGKSVIIVE